MPPQIIDVPGHGQVEFPEGMSDADIVAAIKKNSMGARSWSDVPKEALTNLPSSAMNFAGGLYQAVRHPIDTAGNLWDAAAGGLRNLTPAPVRNLIDKVAPNEEATNRITNTADAVGALYKDRYGSAEGLKKTLATDPVGAAGDLSTVLSLGAGAAGLIPQGAKVAGALNTAAKYTNPLTPVLAGARGVANLAGEAGAQALGFTSGVGAENVKNAYRAGRDGGNFWDNMTGKVPMTDVVDQARQNVMNLKADRSAAYRSGMVDVSKDSTTLDLSKIDNAVKEADKLTSYKGQVINPSAAGKVGEMSKIFEEWLRLDPKQFHTPEGIDALKQKLGSILESIPYEQGQARKAAGGIYNAAKETITDQAPVYSKVMKDYSEASDLIKEVERGLSLKETATVDTALRKLQSLTRNNVSSNYGNRLELGKALSAGGKDLMPALSGQAMNAWAPRGLMGLAPMAEMVGSVASGNPLPLAMLPLSSPRLVGGTLYGAGKAAGMIPTIPNGALPPALLMQRGGALFQ